MMNNTVLLLTVLSACALPVRATATPAAVSETSAPAATSAAADATSPGGERGENVRAFESWAHAQHRLTRTTTATYCGSAPAVAFR